MNADDPKGGSDDLRRKVRESREDVEETVAAVDDPVVGQEKRRKYYSPNEVMKRKGCIGCGGAGVLAALSALALLLIVL